MPFQLKMYKEPTYWDIWQTGEQLCLCPARASPPVDCRLGFCFVFLLKFFFGLVILVFQELITQFVFYSRGIRLNLSCGSGNCHTYLQCYQENPKWVGKKNIAWVLLWRKTQHSLVLLIFFLSSMNTENVIATAPLSLDSPCKPWIFPSLIRTSSL